MLLAVAGLITGWTVNGYRLNKKISDITAEHVEQELKAQQAVRDTEMSNRYEMQKQAEKYQSAIDASNVSIDKLKRELANVSKKNPLPDSCRIGDERMSIIRKAVDSTNSINSNAR